MHNLNLVAGSLGGVDHELASLIDASDTNFRAISANDSELQETLDEFPGTLRTTQRIAGQGCVVRRRAAARFTRCSRSRGTSVRH